MSIEDRVRAKEDNLRTLLLLLLNLLHNNIIDKDRFMELSMNIVGGTSRDVQNLVNEDAGREGLPPADAAALMLLLTRVKVDLAAQADDLEADPEGVKVRVGQTATYTAWGSFMDLMKAVAGKAGLRVMWNTQQDEKVCEVCGPLHGQIFTVEAVSLYPHAGCRCFLTWI